ncbi:putative polynucleotide kinase 3-phosphatase [Trypanosoma theileri]|uniref:Putative polynucleotide kinase 3-phosphatase n=1 Tax=Trypanosoma theileri TaxID=67003 RepID=A0A1X0P298_9TRYP|nr:putative polynucleotide kinase 3-phosphatase [Trypanosoma theileri]ORC91074.1 putative polynucleotide kinase 3-phosphatase [Trypanosoma theileri]
MKRARSLSPKSVKDNILAIPSFSDWNLLHNSVLALLPSAPLVRNSLAVVSEEKLVLKVAAFDLDDTLIMPRSGAVFPRDDPTDWKWLLPTVPRHLRYLHDAGFMVVILSNQSGIGGKSWNEKKADAIKRKIIGLSKVLEMPLAAFVSTKEDEWRKPNVGMWKLLQEHSSTAVGKDVTLSNELPGFVFYVGDAAGRKVRTLAGRKKDFSCSDRKFAFNIEIPFLTPEQLFQCPITELLDNDDKHHHHHRYDYSKSDVEKILSTRLLTLSAAPCEIDWGGVGPDELKGLASSYDNLTVKRIKSDGTKDNFEIPTPATFIRDSQEMVIFVGYPGCGKTTFFKRFFEPAGYVHINRDTLKTKEKCLLEAEKSWKAGKSVVIDNTNPSHSECMQYISVVKQHSPNCSSLPVRIFVFQVSKEMSMHMSNVRARLGIAPRISRIAFNVFHSKLESWISESVKSMCVEELLEIPLVACFDGLPEGIKREFYLLS